MSGFENQWIPNSDPPSLAALDEVGRGPLAGPVVACCTSLSHHDPKKIKKTLHFLNEIGVTDSKALTSLKRQALLKKLEILKDHLFDQPYEIKDLNLHYSLSQVSPQRIDELNIHRSSLLAMEKSFETLYKKQMKTHKIVKWKLLIDGKFPLTRSYKDVEQYPVIKGDQKSALIALASIIAKEVRDDLMKKYHETYSVYGFLSHSGYPTKAHKESLKIHGPSPIHRKSFKGVKELL